MTMYFNSPGEFAAYLQRIVDGMPQAEAAAMNAAAEVIQVEARANLEPLAGSAAALGMPGRGTATRARTLGPDNVERSVEGRTAVVGVPEDSDAADEAIGLELGDVDEPPASFLAAAAFQHGERAAAAAGSVMAAYLAGLGLVEPPKK